MRTLLTDRLREKRTRGGEGVKKAGKSVYVLNGCSLTVFQLQSLIGWSKIDLIKLRFGNCVKLDTLKGVSLS